MDSIFKYISNLFSTTYRVKSLEGLQGLKRIDTILQNLCVQEKVPGIAITLIKKGKTLLNKGYGYSDLSAKTTVNPNQTIFRIASISKCLTGLAFGKMVEEGILDWDDSFYKYVQDYPKKKSDFSLRQLAGHTAGIRQYRGKEFGLNRPYSIKDSLEIFQNDSLVFHPGNGYLYNSFDFVLLSLAMQEASGTPFEDYVKEKVLDPLGLMHTFPPDGHDESVEPSYKVNEYGQVQSDTMYYSKTRTGFKKAIEVNNFYKLAGGGYLSTSADIARLGQAILQENLLSKDTYKQLLTSQMVNTQPTYYGLGFQVSQDEQGRSFVGHVGSSVGAYSNLFVYPKEEMVVSILVNCTDPKIQNELDDIIQSVQ